MNINKLKKYIDTVFANNTTIGDLPGYLTDKLPLFAKVSYRFYLAKILDQDVALLEFKEKEGHAPARLQKESVNIANALQMPVAYLFDSLYPYQRNRLLALRVAFIVPGKQFYMPFLAISFMERTATSRPRPDKLSPASQCLLLYHLQIERLEGLNLQQIAEKLGYSSMTITRAAQQLGVLQLARIEGTKDRAVHFNQQGRVLWEAAEPFLVSPVKQELYLHELPSALKVYIASENAMEAYSNLSARLGHQAYAIGRDAYKVARQSIKGPKRDFDAFEGNVLLQVWHYAPEVLTPTHIVDPLSLYLSVREKTDNERVSMALDQILNHVKWLED